MWVSLTPPFSIPATAGTAFPGTTLELQRGPPCSSLYPPLPHLWTGQATEAQLDCSGPVGSDKAQESKKACVLIKEVAGSGGDGGDGQ